MIDAWLINRTISHANQNCRAIHHFPRNWMALAFPQERRPGWF